MTILKYTALRIALIAAFAGAFYLLGMRSYLLAFAAILCGAMVGFIFFPAQSQAAAGSLEALTRRKPSRTPDTESDEAVEDGSAQS
ncbi:DUF4229 domain-containing protein [Flaviflexus equikiangi]|uniref:DUF4229 domain-containing protein n=1 Tax=Flaviflexus equikiangi TaxID=2758573 RepID=A0ABS2TFW8_9ACTO|nr:DUF4229 domain-containing protein [Flaviflexus equikiangi]MBM9433550.1 DUF4229 domain-containing protein [Flaviflexus equikiangi]